MKRWMLCALAFALSVGLLHAPLGAADEPKKDDKKAEEKKPKPPEDKMPDWSAYAPVDPDGGGEVYKADGDSITIRLTRKGNKANGYKDQHIDTEYKYAEGGMARRKDPPTFFDDKGIKRPAKSEELDKLRKPTGAPGYAIDRTDLKAGDIVTLKLLRPRSISAQKAKPEDYVIKFAIMIGEKPDPKKK